ncbi:MAG: hypothetical protein VKL97_05000 [Cyanobacteriota bacterium]|nr:hypothetical protein [Cyanobacteriota bacterium]
MRSQLLGEAVLLAFDDRLVHGLALRRGAIATPPWQSMLPAQALAHGMPELVDVLGDFLGDLLLSQGLIGHAMRVALPPEAAHWRVISWPFDDWPDDPIEALRTIDPDLRLPFALADAAIDLQPLPGQPLRSLLVAAPQALVEAWTNVFEIAGTPLQRLLPAQVCVRQALLPRFAAADPRDGVLLLQPTGAACSASLWRQGVPLYQRLFEADDPQLAAKLGQIVAYYGSCDAAFSLRRLWLTAELPQQHELEASLGLTLEPLDCAPYDSLVMQGLAQVP